MRVCAAAVFRVSFTSCVTYFRLFARRAFSSRTRASNACAASSRRRNASATSASVGASTASSSKNRTIPSTPSMTALTYPPKAARHNRISASRALGTRKIRAASSRRSVEYVSANPRARSASTRSRNRSTNPAFPSAAYVSACASATRSYSSTEREAMAVCISAYASKSLDAAYRVTAADVYGGNSDSARERAASDVFSDNARAKTYFFKHATAMALSAFAGAVTASRNHFAASSYLFLAKCARPP